MIRHLWVKITILYFAIMIVLTIASGNIYRSSLVEVSLAHTCSDVTMHNSVYDDCVPIEALYKENDNYYLYIAYDKDTTLGTELAAKKIYVNVLEQNEEYAAVEGNGFYDDQGVIIKPSKQLYDQAFIRVRKQH